MRISLIGVILKSLTDEYNAGACDNLTEEEQHQMLESLIKLKDSLDSKSDTMLTTEEVSQYLRVSRQTISKYVKEGLLKPTKHLGGVLEFKLRDIKNFVYSKEK